MNTEHVYDQFARDFCETYGLNPENVDDLKRSINLIGHIKAALQNRLSDKFKHDCQVCQKRVVKK